MFQDKFLEGHTFFWQCTRLFGGTRSAWVELGEGAGGCWGGRRGGDGDKRVLFLLLRWNETKFGDAGDDGAPRGAASGVNEMYADTEQLACVRLMTEQRRRGRESRKSAVLAAQSRQTAQSVRNYAAQSRNQSPEGGDLLPAPRPTLIFSKNTSALLSLSTLCYQPVHNGEAVEKLTGRLP